MGRDGYAGLAVLAASLALFWATLGLQQHPLVPIGPGFYPRIVLGVTAALGALLLAADLLAARKRAPEAAGERPNYPMVLLTFGIFAAYVVLMPYLGFRAATFAFMVAMQSALDPPRGARRWISILVAALAATAAAYYVFEQYLNVLLPRGHWTDF